MRKGKIIGYSILGSLSIGVMVAISVQMGAWYVGPGVFGMSIVFTAIIVKAVDFMVNGI